MFFLKIDRELHLPLYHQIEKVLEDNILSGKWMSGYQLPTEKELSEHFDVSTITVKRAILELVNKGFLYRQRGKGTFVSTHPLREKELSKNLTLIDGGDSDLEHRTLNYSIEKADISIGRQLDIPADEEVINLVRLKIEEEEPFGIEYTYLPNNLFPNFSPKLVENNLLYHMIEKNYGIDLDYTKIYFSITIADEFQSKILDVDPGTPLIIWERYTYTSNQTIVEYSKMVFRQDKDRYFLKVNLN